MGHVKEFVQHLSENVSQIYSQLDTALVRRPEEMPVVKFCPIIWDWSEPV